MSAADDESAARVIEATNRIYERIALAGIDALEADSLLCTLSPIERSLTWLLVTSRASVSAQFLAQQQGVPPDEIVRWVHIGAQLGIEINKAMQTKPNTEKLQ